MMAKLTVLTRSCLFGWKFWFLTFGVSRLSLQGGLVMSYYARPTLCLFRCLIMARANGYPIVLGFNGFL